MSSTTLAIIVLVAFLAMLMLGVHVCVAMLLCGVVGCAFVLPSFSSALSLLSGTFTTVFTSYTISVAPMFMLMGEIASESGVGKNLFSSFQIILGRIPGSLASSVQVACAIFGAICGSSPATTALMSRVAYPEMKRHGYSDSLACGSVVSGASLATLIPPSLILISYGVAAEESIGRLFMGGIFTGIVLMLLFIVTIQIYVLISPKSAPRAEKTSWKEKLIAIKKGNIIDVIVIFGFSMIGMFLGWFTATEAGAIGSVLMLIDTILNKRFSFKMFINAIRNAMVMSGMIYMLIVGANVLGKLFTFAQIPTMLGNFVANMNVSGYAVVFVITVIFLILGCFMDVMSVVLIVTPMFLPVLRMFGYDGIWFGVYCVVVSNLGALTPPVGMGCYMVSGITKVKLPDVFKGAVPFVVAFLLTIVVMAVFPQIVTWLPSKIMG